MATPPSKSRRTRPKKKRSRSHPVVIPEQGFDQTAYKKESRRRIHQAAAQQRLQKVDKKPKPPWLIPLLVFLTLLVVSILALVASSGDAG